MPSLSFSALMSSIGNRLMNRRCRFRNRAKPGNSREQSRSLSAHFTTSMCATGTPDDREYIIIVGLGHIPISLSYQELRTGTTNSQGREDSLLERPNPSG